MLAVPVVLLAVSAAQAANILMGNDDGWATSNIRAMFNALDAAGHNVVLSSPAIGMSGTGSTDLPAVPVLFGCQFDSCPALSPAHGFNASDPRLNYVNSFPVSAIKYGLSTLAPKFFAPGGKPDLVVAGPNVGDNTGLLDVAFSGTLGVACAGAQAGVPALGFSGASGEKVSYLSAPNSVAYSAVYAGLAAAFVQHVLAKGARPLLPPGVALNVNYPPVDKEGGCTAPQYVLSRQASAVPWGTADVEVCGNGGRLPKEEDVMAAKGCWASVTVLDMNSKFDVGADLQGKVVGVIGDLLTCLPK